MGNFHQIETIFIEIFKNQNNVSSCALGIEKKQAGVWESQIFQIDALDSTFTYFSLFKWMTIYLLILQIDAIFQIDALDNIFTYNNNSRKRPVIKINKLGCGNEKFFK